jgi:hypothetical protein
MEELSKCMVRGGMFTDGWFLRDLFVYFVLAHTNAGEVAQDTTPPTAAPETAPDEPAITQTGLTDEGDTSDEERAGQRHQAPVAPQAGEDASDWPEWMKKQYTEQTGRP